MKNAKKGKKSGQFQWSYFVARVTKETRREETGFAETRSLEDGGSRMPNCLLLFCLHKRKAKPASQLWARLPAPGWAQGSGNVYQGPGEGIRGSFPLSLCIFKLWSVERKAWNCKCNRK